MSVFQTKGQTLLEFLLGLPLILIMVTGITQALHSHWNQFLCLRDLAVKGRNEAERFVSPSSSSVTRNHCPHGYEKFEMNDLEHFYSQ